MSIIPPDPPGSKPPDGAEPDWKRLRDRLSGADKTPPRISRAPKPPPPTGRPSRSRQPAELTKTIFPFAYPPPISIDYPSRFPPKSIARISSAHVSGEKIPDKKRVAIKTAADAEAALLRFVLSVFRVVNREFFHFALEKGWATNRYEATCWEILQQYAIRAGLYLDIRQDLMVLIQSSEVWREFRNRVTKLGKHSRPKKKRTNKKDPRKVAEKKARALGRQTGLKLLRGELSPHKLGEQIGMVKALYNYLDGTSVNPLKLRIAVAAALGVEVERIPH